jgi:hypothetical protein
MEHDARLIARAARWNRPAETRSALGRAKVGTQSLVPVSNSRILLRSHPGRQDLAHGRRSGNRVDRSDDRRPTRAGITAPRVARCGNGPRRPVVAARGTSQNKGDRSDSDEPSHQPALLEIGAISLMRQACNTNPFGRSETGQLTLTIVLDFAPSQFIKT